ncbi:MAG TPA: hypothetical protein VKR22_12330 [Acidimicrobiales bacterium]|nr:hypothetical protein [Acidimicrobiales bacterium]
MTFVSASTGFVIGVDSSCPATSCVALARTRDGGATWTSLPGPPAAYAGRIGQATAGPGVSEVRFADALNGWIFGPALFATHDGGATWQAVPVNGSVLSLETSSGYVDAVISPCAAGQDCRGSARLEQAPVASGNFAVVLSGVAMNAFPAGAAVLALHAPVGFVNLDPNVVPASPLHATTALAHPDSWHPFPNPCSVTAGYQLTAFAAPDTTRLFTLCSGSGAAGSMLKSVVETENGSSRAVGTPPMAGDSGTIAAASASTVVVSAVSAGSWLYRSTDGGRTWVTAADFHDGGTGFSDLGFTTATQGVVIHGFAGPPANPPTQLLITHDGGATWKVVPIG